MLSGKSSPCPSYSGKSSPCSTIEETDINRSSRKKLLELIIGNDSGGKVGVAGAPKSPNKTIGEVSPVAITNIINNNNTTNNNSIELSKIPEENGQKMITWNDIVEQENVLGTLSKCHQYSQTDLDDENLTLAEWKLKYEGGDVASTAVSEITATPEIVIQTTTSATEILSDQIIGAVEFTTNKLNAMENEFLAKQQLAQKSLEIKPSPTTELKKQTATVQPQISPKYSSVLNKTSRNPIVTAARQPPTRAITRPISVQHKVAVVETKKRPIRTTILPNAPKPYLNKTKTNLPNHDNYVAQSNRQNDNIVPSNVANRLSARSKTMIEISNNRNARFQNRSFNKAQVTQSRDDLNSSSSTLKASCDQIHKSKSSLNGSKRDLTNRIRDNEQYRKSEPKTMPTEENDGWLTVKAKRRSSLHWANRFNQPTGYASLPSLALQCTESTDTETADEQTETEKRPATLAVTKKLVKTAQSSEAVKQRSSAAVLNSVGLASRKLKTTTTGVVKRSNDAAKLPATSTLTRPATGKIVLVKSAKSVDAKSVTRENIVKRQKSDVTGLKLTTLHKEYIQNENRYKSKVTPKTSTNVVVVLNQTHADMKTQTGNELSAAITDLYTSLNHPNNQHLNGIGGIGRDASSSCDELEDRDDIESDEDQRKLLEEQESLERQIRELQNTEIDVDTETDETDCDVMLDLKDIETSTDEPFDTTIELDNENISLEMRYQSLLSDMSLGERVETLATLQAFVSRHPGRAQELHQKLSSPSRRRSLHETLKKYQAKQARAQEKRESLNKEKAQKIQILLARVEDVKAAKQHLIEEKRMRMEERLQRAADNRNQYLKDKIRKAHDEEEKLKEIAFIKNLEAQNKRLDFMESWKEQEGRLQDLEQERQKKVEEKAAKEAAVEKRRLELELDRQRRLEKMNETRLICE